MKFEPLPTLFHFRMQILKFYIFLANIPKKLDPSLGYKLIRSKNSLSNIFKTATLIVNNIEITI